MMGDPEQTVMLTERDLARRWGMAPGTLANMRSAGRGPAVLRIGGRAVRYLLSDVIAFEAASRTEGEAA